MPKPAKTSRNRLTRRSLSRDLIVADAVTLADASGLEGLSMRKLAERLGVEAMSLYNYLPNKDALIDAMVDEVVGEIALPRVGKPWIVEMRGRANSASEALLRHTWAPMPILSRINTGPRMLAYMDRTQGCLLAAGFSHARADGARHLLDSHTYGYVLQELHFPIRPEDYAASAAAFLPMIPASTHPHLRGIAEAIVAGEYDGRNSFTFGLDLILGGLARLLAANTAPPRNGERRVQ